MSIWRYSDFFADNDFVARGDKRVNAFFALSEKIAEAMSVNIPEEGWMNTLAISLAAARAMLKMNVKSVAAAIRISDRTISKLENDADIVDNNVQTLLQFYEDCGLYFQRDVNNEIVGVIASPELKLMTLIVVNEKNPYSVINEIKHSLRQIRGVVSKIYSTDKSTAELGDTIELHVPVDARPLAVKAISSILSKGIKIDFIDKDGVQKSLSPSSLSAFLE